MSRSPLRPKKEPKRPPQSVPNANLFSEDYRREDVAALYQAIHAREGRVLVSLPQTGISSLLRFLRERRVWNDLHVYCAYVNCESPAVSADLVSLYEALANEFIKQKLGKADLHLRGYARLADLLERAGTHSQRRLIVILDEADGLTDIGKDSFYRDLETLTDLNEDVVHLIAIKPRTVADIDPEERLFAGRHLYLGPLNARDFKIALAHNQERHQIRFDETAADKLARMSGGHAGLLRGIVSASVRLNLDWNEPEAELLEKLIAENDVQARCRKILKGLDAASQDALVQLARGKIQNVSAQQRALFLKLRMFQETPSPKFFSTVLQKFLLQKIPTTEPHQPASSKQLQIRIERVKIVGSPKREIPLRGRVLVDGKPVKLSALEFQLVAYLTQQRSTFLYHQLENDVLLNGQGTAQEKPFGSQALQSLVKDVRQVLGKQCIRNEFSVGYEFVWDGEIERVKTEPSNT